MKPETSKRTFVWNGITIELTHEKFCSTMRDLHHLAILSIQPYCAPLPFTDTGYRSHFYYGEPIEDTVVAVRNWLDDEAQSKEWKAREAARRQFNLF